MLFLTERLVDSRQCEVSVHTLRANGMLSSHGLPLVVRKNSEGFKLLSLRCPVCHRLAEVSDWTAPPRNSGSVVQRCGRENAYSQLGSDVLADEGKVTWDEDESWRPREISRLGS